MYINDIFEKAKNDPMIIILSSDELKKIKRREAIVQRARRNFIYDKSIQRFIIKNNQ